MIKPSLALVTGATSGIGKALCELLADKGVDLIITGRNENLLLDLKQGLQSKVKINSICADLTCSEDRKSIIQQLHQQVPDLVINNAGFGLYGDSLTYTTHEQMQVLDVNGSAVLELTLEAARSLVSQEKKGTIINISSAAAFQVFPSLAVYSASKAFVNQVSQALDSEMKSYGIRVLTSCPGMVDTQFRERAGGAPGVHTGGQPMTAEFVAQEIWKQFQLQKPLKIINWKYHLLTFLSSFLPTSLSSVILRKNILQRIAPRTIIKVNHDS